MLREGTALIFETDVIQKYMNYMKCDKTLNCNVAIYANFWLTPEHFSDKSSYCLEYCHGMHSGFHTIPYTL